MFDPVENTGATGVANVRPQRMWLRKLVVLVMLVDFGCFGLFCYQATFSQTGAVVLAEREQGPDQILWPDFVWEAERFYKSNTQLISWIMDKYVHLRAKAHYLADYFCLKIIRMANIGFYMAGCSILLLFVAVEGLIRRERKKKEFRNVSSTLYHISLRAGAGALLSLVLVYLFIPNGQTLSLLFPEIVPSPSSLWVEPVLWAGAIFISTAAVVYNAISNLSGDI